jgi:hypothetical protein
MPEPFSQNPSDKEPRLDDHFSRMLDEPAQEPVWCYNFAEPVHAALRGRS